MPEPIDTPPVYQNRFMAPNGFSGIHLNSYMTDSGTVEGPASGPNPLVKQQPIASPGIAATIAFNAKGQLVTIHIGSPKIPGGVPTIRLIDPTTLDTLFKVELPPRPSSGDKISFAGGYFYLDQNSNVVCVTADQQIRIYSTGNSTLVLLQTYDLRASISDSSDILNSVLPDSLGNIWYITQKGVIGYLDKDTLKPSPVVRLNEPISKSFASDNNNGVYIVTDCALYCYQSLLTQGPMKSWRTEYDRGTTMKPGQNQIGSGTTPTCFDFQGSRLVAITDNADQMHVNVYDRDNGNLVAQEEVFTDWPEANACENSLIAVNGSIIVENNYGNRDIQSTAGDKMTTPGVNRVDIDPDKPLHQNSSVVWVNNDVAVPSVVSQLSTGDGMIYTYAKDSGGWYWAALDFETGDIVKRSEYVTFPNAEKLEEASNNWYAGLTVGPDGDAYLSVFGGLTVWRKAS